MEHYNDGDINVGPLIDLNTEDFCLTVKDMTIAKFPVPVGSSMPHSTQHNSDGTVDQVLKAITALIVIVHSTKLVNFDWSRAVQLIPNCTP